MFCKSALRHFKANNKALKNYCSINNFDHKPEIHKGNEHFLEVDTDIEVLSKRVEERVKELMSVSQSKKKVFVRMLEQEKKVFPEHIFATTRDLKIADVECVGFDYDYTLANYNDHIQPLIYTIAQDHLIDVMGYPQMLRESSSYDPLFAIRGLSYDIRKGILFKMDYLYNIQVDTAYHGRKSLTPSQINNIYGAPHISYKSLPNIRAMIDTFSLPEACLISDIIEFFNQKKIAYDPGYIYADVRRAIDHVHTSGLLHGDIKKRLSFYLDKKRPQIEELLQTLKNKKKKLFLLTNSPYKFVDAGMTHIINKDWMQLFDIVMTSADKPDWFTSARPFREVDKEDGKIYWDKVNNFEPGKIYCQGSMEEFKKMTNFFGNEVLYLGDHLFSDLKEPSRTGGWRTGVIISELKKEIEIQNTKDYTDNLMKLLQTVDLRRKLDMLEKNKEDEMLKGLTSDVNRLRKGLKSMFNVHFGSVFRTHSNATLFGYLLLRYADIYTSSVENFAVYPFDYTFSVRRTFLPHEVDFLRPIK